MAVVFIMSFCFHVLMYIGAGFHGTFSFPWTFLSVKQNLRQTRGIGGVPWGTDSLKLIFFFGFQGGCNFLGIGGCNINIGVFGLLGLN